MSTKIKINSKPKTEQVNTTSEELNVPDFEQLSKQTTQNSNNSVVKEVEEEGTKLFANKKANLIIGIVAAILIIGFIAAQIFIGLS